MASVETNLYYPDDMTIEDILEKDLTTLERLRQTERQRKLQAGPFTDDITPLSHMPAGRRIFKILRGINEGDSSGTIDTLYFQHSQDDTTIFPKALRLDSGVELSKVNEKEGGYNGIGIYECNPQTNTNLPHRLAIRIGKNGNENEWHAILPTQPTEKPGGEEDDVSDVFKMNREDEQKRRLALNMYEIDKNNLVDNPGDNFVTVIRDFDILPKNKDGLHTLTPFDRSEKIWMFANNNDICPKIYLYDYVKGNNVTGLPRIDKQSDYHVFHACMISEAYNASLHKFYERGGKLEDLRKLSKLAADADIFKQIDNKVGQQLAECYGKLIDKGIFCVDVNPGNIVIKFNEDPEISAYTLLTSITVRLIDLDNDYCYLNYNTVLGKDFKESDVDKGEIHFYIKILTLMQLANICLFQFQKNFLVDEIKKLIANHMSISDMEENNIENECKNLYCKLLQHFKKGGKHDSFLKRTKKYSKIDDGYVKKEILEKSPEGIIERKTFADAKTYDTTGLPDNETDLLQLRFDNSTTDPELVFEYMWINAFKRTPDDTSVSETTGDCGSSTLEEKGDGDNKKLGAKADIGQCNLAARTKRAFKKSDRLNKTRKRMSDNLSDTRARMKASKMPKMKMPKMDIGPVGPSAHEVGRIMGQMTSAALFGY